MTITINFKKNDTLVSAKFRDAKGFRAGTSVLTVFDDTDNEVLFDLSRIESILVLPEVK